MESSRLKGNPRQKRAGSTLAAHERIDCALDGCLERASVARIDPALVRFSEMHASQMRGEPDFLHRRLDVDDCLSAVLELNREDVSAPCAVDILVLRFNMVLKAVHFRLGLFQKFRFRHFLLPMKKSFAAGAAGIALALCLVLSGCGLKGPLYMPGEPAQSGTFQSGR